MERKRQPLPTVIVPGRKYVMTNDPSMAAWGWAVVDPTNHLIVEVGAIQTKPNTRALRVRKGDDRVRRITELNTGLIKVFKKYQIGLITSELPHGSQNAAAATMIGITTGIIQ